MKLDSECRLCLQNSQLAKVECERGGDEKFDTFRRGVKSLCENAPENYCAPLLARDINLLHFKTFGEIIDYSKEKQTINAIFLNMEDRIYSVLTRSSDPLKEALKYSMAANYIDFARLHSISCDCGDAVVAAGRICTVDEIALQSLKDKLSRARTVCILHDNCGEIVLDKILIKVIKELYPSVSPISVVRGKPVINDVTEEDARQTGLYSVSEVISNGTDVPGTCMKEISAKAREAITNSDVVISKGLGNLETLMGSGISAFYAFTCKCKHISRQFGVKLWKSALIETKE